MKIRSKPIEFDRFRIEAGLNAFTMSPQKWIEATSTDLPIIQKLVKKYGWKVGEGPLYQQIYDVPVRLRKEYFKTFIKQVKIEL